ncbi:PilZ domain-containing protein [Pseudomonadota bacterium]
MSDKGNPVPSKEARRFFRVDDIVHLSYSPVSQEQLVQRLEQQDVDTSTSFTILGELSVLSQQMAAQMHRIESDSPEIAAYLKSLDKKVELLARAFLCQELESDEQTPQRVNISAGGLAVSAKEAIAPGTLVEIKLMLMPAMTGIITYGEIIACEKSGDKEQPYQVRIDFTYIREADRELLIRHMLRRQGQMLRESREEQDSMD